MKKLKIKAALILLMALIMPALYSQSKTKSETKPTSKFKIELQKQVYNKKEVEKICAIFQSEMEKSIDIAFDEGYKQGLLSSAPDALFYKTLAKDLEKEVKRLNSWQRVPWWSIPVAIISGATLGFAFSYLR